MPAKPTDFLLVLEQIISARRADRSEGSYTATLFNAGTKRIAQKVGEEGVELALAAVTNDKDEVVNESADLIYHLLVLLADQGVTLNDVAMTLEKRHKAS